MISTDYTIVLPLAIIFLGIVAYVTICNRKYEMKLQEERLGDTKEVKKKLGEERMGAIQKRREALELLRDEGKQAKNPGLCDNNGLVRDYGFSQWFGYYSHIKGKELPFKLEWVDSCKDELERLKVRSRDISYACHCLVLLRSSGYNQQFWLSWEWNLGRFRELVSSLGIGLELFETSEEELANLFRSEKLRRAQTEHSSFRQKIGEAYEHINRMTELLNDSGGSRSDMGVSLEDEYLELQVRTYLKCSEEENATR